LNVEREKEGGGREMEKGRKEESKSVEASPPATARRSCNTLVMFA
jgi:hypothetical protein